MATPQGDWADGLTAPTPTAAASPQPSDAAPNWADGLTPAAPTQDAVAARHARSAPANVNYGQPEDTGVLSNLATGAAKGAGETVQGAASLLGAKKLVNEGMLGDTDTSAQGVAQQVGKGAENVAEWAGGDAALEGMAKLVKVPESVLALAEKYPTAAKLLHAAVKGGTIGAAQGAVKGAATGEAKEGAEGGALGGAFGGAAAEGVAAGAPLIKKVAQGAGIGMEPVDALTRALRPTGKTALKFPENATLALPRLVAENKVNPITNLDELSDAAHSTAQKLWNNEIIPQIQKYAAETIPGQPIATAIRKGVSVGDKDLFEGASDAAEALAQKFDGEMNLQQAADRLQSLNRKVASLYRLDPASRYAATANNTSLEAMEDAANELRQQIYTKLESLGEKDPAGLRKTYGALKQVEQAANKRAVVYGRQNPINLSQVLATAGGMGEAAGALFTGHPLAALAGAAPIIVTTIAKRLNAPEHLIQSALQDGLEESGLVKKGALAVGQGAKRVAPAAGAAAGRFLIRASDGSMHSFDDTPENRTAVQRIDPGHTVIQP